VMRHGHDRLPTYGLGRENPAPFWRGVIRQLLARGVVRSSSGEYPTLELEDTARPILRGEEPVMMRAAEPRRPTPRVAREGSRATAPVGEGGPLFDALRAWRSGEAKVQSVPPYVIFHDSVLREIAEVQPRTLDELGQLRGVGVSKLDRYGKAVLRIVKEDSGA
jgi:ATP-dependent DNA helicase RecQ